MKRIVTAVVFCMIVCGRGIAQERDASLFVLNGLARTVSIMNLNSGQIVNDVVTTGEIPSRILSHDDKVFVVNAVPAGLTVIDAETGQLLDSVSLPTGSNPWSMAFVSDNKAYVSYLLANTIGVIDPVTGDSLTTIPVGRAPQGILVAGARAYVANTGGFPDYAPSTVSVIDVAGDTVIATVAVATNPQELAVDASGKIHVVCTGNFGDVSGKVFIITPDETGFAYGVTDSVLIGGTPSDIAVTKEGLAYLTDFGDGANGLLYSYSVETLQIRNDSMNPIRVGNGAMNLTYHSTRNELYVNNFADDRVQLLDPSDGSVITSFDFGDGAQDMALVETDSPTSVDLSGGPVPETAILEQNYPNPFNPQTVIPFALARRQHVKIAVYDLRGRRLRNILDRELGPGNFEVTWDGSDQANRPVASGLYFYRMTTENGLSQVRRMTLLR